MNASYLPQLQAFERQILSNQTKIEAWFRSKWKEHKPPFYGSVDIRNAGYKMASIDMNLFPGGFNNLNPNFIQLASHAALDAGRPLLVCATHLAPNSALNSRQLAWLERRLPRIARRRGIRGAPILVLGDLNMDVEKVRRESGLGVLAEGLTYPEDAPDAQIDHVLGWGMVPGGEASVVHLPVSDHAGLVADAEFE